MNRQKVLLFVLVGVLLLALGYAFQKFPHQQTATSSSGKGSVAGRKPAVPQAQGTGGDEGGVRLDLLSREKEPFPGYERDIFGPLYVVKPPPPPPPPPPPQIPVVQAPPPQPVAPIQQELARFTFLGFLKKDEEKTVFLSSNGEIYVVKQGDRFGRQKEFLVTDVGPERLIIRQGEDPRPIQIALIEKEPLIPVMSRPSGAGLGSRFSLPPRPSQPEPEFQEIQPVEPLPPEGMEMPPLDEELR